MNNVLVTGGAGFIGKHFLARMLRNRSGRQYINLDLLTYAADHDALERLSSYDNYTFYKGDIRDQELVRTILSTHKIGSVVNFAAESHVDRGIVNPALFFSVNLGGTQVLLDALREHSLMNMDGRRVLFIQISTDEVYGERTNEKLFDEENPLRPGNPYAASKAAADLLVYSYQKTYQLPAIITRSCNNYGYGQYPEKLIPLFIKKARANEKMPLYRQGRESREWLHVEDHVSALEMVISHGRVGEIYNIGSGEEVQNREIAHLILDALGKEKDLIEFVADRAGHDRQYGLDSRKIMQELGWLPQYKLEKELRKMALGEKT